MARRQKMIGSTFRGDASRILATLRGSREPEVLRNQLMQAGRMSVCFPTNRELYDQVSDNPDLRYDPDTDRIVVEQRKDLKPVVLSALGREAVARFEKTRFTLNLQVTARAPGTVKIATGAEAARLLDMQAKPAEKVGLLARHPRIASAQLATSAGSLAFATLGEVLGAAKPPFTAAEHSSSTCYAAEEVTVGERRVTMVKASRQLGVFTRGVVLAMDGQKPKQYGQGVALTERQYTAVADEWVSDLPAQLWDADGLVLNEPLEELAYLLAAQDPTIAVPVGGSTWMRQEIRPLGPTQV